MGYKFINVNGRMRSEHRYVVERAIGRPLKRTEHVHHKNGNPSDNRLKNLKVCSASEHRLIHAEEKWCSLPPDRRFMEKAISVKPWMADWAAIKDIATHPHSMVHNISEILRHAIRFGLPEAKRRLITPTPHTKGQLGL